MKIINYNKFINESLTDDAFKAIEDFDISTLQRLIKEEGVDINSKDKIEMSLLSIASYYGDLSIVTWLVDNGADIHSVNRAGDNALMQTLYHLVNTDIVEYLISVGIDVNKKNNGGYTPIMWASTKMKILKILIEAGADVNAQNNDGDTVLYSAASRLEIEIVEELLKHGSDINIQNSYGKTPLIGMCESGTGILRKMFSKKNKILDMDKINVFLDNGAEWDIIDNNERYFLDYLTVELKKEFQSLYPEEYMKYYKLTFTRKFSI